VRVADLAERAADGVDLPALLLLGARDEIVPNGRVRRVFARLDGPRRVIEYPQGWHLLFRDLQAARVWRDVADWVLSGAPRRPACAPPAGLTPR
jgi:alpha-beta hydrolase superfamily lysophospholipase